MVFLLALSNKLRVTSVEIFDVMGRKVFEQKAEGNLTVLNHPVLRTPLHSWRGISFDITVLPSGTYFVKISTEAGDVVRKVVKE